MAIAKNKLRVANFTSSEIYRLTGIGTRLMTDDELKAYKQVNPKSRKRTIECDSVPDAKFYEYVKEKYYESKLNRSLSTDAYSKAIAWGNLMEHHVFGLMGLDYELISNKTFKHPTVKNWSGSPDMRKPKKLVVDIKGYQLKAYCDYYEVLEQQNISILKENNSKEYWQLVSNAAINNTPEAEAILFAPKMSDANEIKELAETFGTWEYRYIWEEIDAGNTHKLPFLPDDSYYAQNGNMMRFRFKVPQKDLDFIKMRVEMASKELDKMLKPKTK